MSVLITGANGYLGKRLVAWLLDRTKLKIVALDLKIDEQNISTDRIQWVKMSLSDIDRFDQGAEKIELIVHLAAKIAVNNIGLDGSTDLFEQNCFNTLKLLDWAQKNEITKILFVSSMTVYAKNKGQGLIQENAPKEPESMYGLTKALSEELLKLYSKKSSLRSIVVRLPGLYGGERKNGLMYNLAQKIKGGLPVELDLAGLGNWETVHVDDVAEILGEIIALNKFKAPFEAFNLGYADKRVAVGPIIELMRQHYKSRSAITIKNKAHYRPFTMSNRKLKGLLGKFPIKFKPSLEKYLDGIA